MKKITFGILPVFIAVVAAAQSVVSVSVIPSPASANDNLQAVVTTTYPGGPCSFVSAFPMTQSNDTIIFDAIYCYESNGPEACSTTDTFAIGQLSEGNYVIRFRLTSTAQGGPCGSLSYMLRDIEIHPFTVGNGTVGIGSAASAVAVVSPNPVTDRVYFSFERNGAAEVTLFDISGKAVKTQKFEQAGNTPLMLDVADLSANVYFYRIKTETHTFTGKLVIAG